MNKHLSCLLSVFGGIGYGGFWGFFGYFWGPSILNISPVVHSGWYLAIGAVLVWNLLYLIRPLSSAFFSRVIFIGVNGLVALFVAYRLTPFVISFTHPWLEVSFNSMVIALSVFFIALISVFACSYFKTPSQKRSCGSPGH